MIQFKVGDVVMTSRKRIGVIVIPPEYLVETDECAISTYDVNDVLQMKNENIRYRIVAPSVKFGNGDVLNISSNQLNKISSINVKSDTIRKSDFAKVIDFCSKNKIVFEALI